MKIKNVSLVICELCSLDSNQKLKENFRKKISNEGVICDDCLEQYLLQEKIDKKIEAKITKMLCWV